MTKVQNGNFVQVHYIGSLEDGTVFDSSEGRNPLEFQAGSGKVIPGFDHAVIGMEINQEKVVSLSKDEAYGDPREDLVREFPVTMMGEEKVELGQDLWFNSPGGPVNGKVHSLAAETFKVDFNHPLAGQNLQFSIRLVGITDQPTQMSSCSCSSCGTDPSSGCGPNCG